MPRHAGLALLFFFLLLFTSSRALAAGWTEIHQSADDVHITVGPDGVATIEHRLRYRIVAGKFKAFELAGVDPSAELEPETVVVPEKGTEVEARVETNPKLPGTLRVVFDEPKKGLGRGVYLMSVKYKLDLVAAKLLARDGGMWKLTWTGAPAPEGRDGARVVFELASAPTEPRLASPEQAATTLATLRRQAERDELELVRTHVPRGEAPAWSIRVDPHAFPKIATPELRPTERTRDTIAAAAAPVSNPAPAVALAAALAALAGAFAMLLRAKQSAVAAACEALHATPRPLVPLPFGLGPFAYGAAVAASIALLLVGTPMHGALLVTVAMALAAHRSPAPSGAPRGPGRWRPVADADVLLPRGRDAMMGDALDITTTRGRIVLLLASAAVAAGAFFLRAHMPGAGIAIPLAAASLAPIFVTGTRAQLPQTPLALASRLLRPVRDALAGHVDLAHVDLQCVARVREKSESIDEVRLACAPEERIPGLRAIELALAASAIGAVPEVLVRFDDASEAAAKIASLAPGVPVVVGRAPEEKVLRLAPTTPSAAGAAKLVARLLAELEGRRASDRDVPESGAAYVGPERRKRRAFTACLAAAAM